MADIEHLNQDQLDALQETGNMDCSHVATAVSQMIGKPVEISVPHLRIIKTSELENTLINMFGGRKTVGVYLGLTNEFQGSILFVFPYESDLSLTDALRKNLGSSKELDEMAKSALMEAGNIVVSAYANALGSLLNTLVVLSLPSFTCDTPKNIIGNLQTTLGDATHALIFDIKFRGADNLFLLSSSRSLDTLLHKLVSYIEGIYEGLCRVTNLYMKKLQW